MGIWNWWTKQTKKTAKGADPHDVLYPESKGRLTLKAIREAFNHVGDMMYKTINAGQETVTLVYMSTLVDPKAMQEIVFDPLDRIKPGIDPQKYLKSSSQMKEDQLPKAIADLAAGFTLLFFVEREVILKINTFSPPERSLSPSETETTVLGPQDSFNESLDTSLSLIKRRIRSPHLKCRRSLIGTETHNDIAVLYLDHIANPENVERVLYRLQNIEFQGFIGMPVLNQMLEDKPYSPFPQFVITMRPDNVVSNLLDGRIAVMINGSPEAVICPSSFFEMFTSPEDLYNRWTTATLLRSIRFGGFFITILLTSSYVSVLTFHTEMLPPALLTLLSESRSKVPFPPLIEVLAIELVIEILREAGARMPTKIGQTLGIVGGIVIGTASVEAGLASNILIVLVATSALLSFLPTNYLMSNAARFIRYAFILSAGLLGMYGQALALAWLTAHLSNITSLGSPYLSPFPRKWSDLGNSVFRAPINFFMNRSGLSRAQKEMTRPVDEE